MGELLRTWGLTTILSGWLLVTATSLFIQVKRNRRERLNRQEPLRVHPRWIAKGDFRGSHCRLPPNVTTFDLHVCGRCSLKELVKQGAFEALAICESCREHWRRARTSPRSRYAQIPANQMRHGPFTDCDLGVLLHRHHQRSGFHPTAEVNHGDGAAAVAPTGDGHAQDDAVGDARREAIDINGRGRRHACVEESGALRDDAQAQFRTAPPELKSEPDQREHHPRQSNKPVLHLHQRSVTPSNGRGKED